MGNETTRLKSSGVRLDWRLGTGDWAGARLDKTRQDKIALHCNRRIPHGNEDMYTENRAKKHYTT